MIFINSDPANTSVSGGKVTAISSNDGSTHKLTSRAPFWDLEIARNTSVGTNRPIVVTNGSSGDNAEEAFVSNQPLIVKNKLTITGANSPTLSMDAGGGVFNDAYVSGDFIVQNGGTYNHGANTTFLDGNANTFLSLPTTSTITFNNLVIDKSSGTRFAEIQAGNSFRALEIQGEFRIENGFLENNNLNVSVKGDMLNRSFIGTDPSTGLIAFEGSSPQTIRSQNASFQNLRIANSSGVSLEDDGITVRRQMAITSGNFFLGSNKVRVEGVNGSLSVSSPSATRCFVTDGTASAGGLEMIYKAANQLTVFPIGVPEGASVKYSPATIGLNNGFVDDGYIQVVPVNSFLLTANTTVGNDYLDFYWRVRHSEFDNIPNASHSFKYDDLDIVGTEANFASGRVLSVLPFTRSVDSTSVSTDNVETGSNLIYFNGLTESATLTGTGTLLSNADYSAGNWQRFDGRPQVFFSKSSVYEPDWTNPTVWNELSEFSVGDGPYQYHGAGTAVNTDFPEAGDIAFIGFNPANGKPHVYAAPSGGVLASQVNFTPLQTVVGVRTARYYDTGTPVSEAITILRPTLSFDLTSAIDKIGQITGEGTLLIKGVADITATDIGDFLSEDSSIVMIQPEITISLITFPVNIPNLFIADDGDGFVEITSLQSDILVRGDLEITGRSSLLLPSGTAGNIEVRRNLILAKYQSSVGLPRFLFNNSGNAHRVEVLGDIRLLSDGAIFSILNPNTATVQIHDLIVWKNIIQNGVGAGLTLFTSPNADYVNLTVKGVGNHSLVNTTGNTPKIGRIIVDKGIDISSSFSFNSDIDILGPSNLAQKSVELRNGLLRFNDPGITATLSDGGANFTIPATAGLDISGGTFSINSPEIGLLLDGSLKISGGALNIGDTEGEHNFIEYTSSGASKIEITGGSLLVGSQIRRGITNNSGTLDYRQSGGDVVLGRYSTLITTRSVLEVFGASSRFDHTAGNLTIVRGVNSAARASLFLDPGTFNVGGTSTINIGNANSPTNASMKNFGIHSVPALNNLNIVTNTGNDPIVRIQTVDLSLKGDLSIDAGATLNGFDRTLLVNGDITVQSTGALNFDMGTLILNHTSSGLVSGAGSYNLYNLQRIGGAATTTTFSNNILVKNNLNTDQGSLIFGDNAITLRGNAVIDGKLDFSSLSNGLIFQGATAQTLTRTASGTMEIDAITTDNSSGISMLSTGLNLIVAERIRMVRGIFGLQGNLMELLENSEIEAINAFGNQNMIVTGGSFSNFGVRKYVPANNTTEDLFLPLGIDVYMPVNLIFSEPGYTSGSTPSSYLFRLNIPEHPIIIQDTEPVAPQINDEQNVLGMYFSMNVDGLGTGLRMDAKFQYDESYVRLANGMVEADYIATRVFGTTVSKFGAGDVDEDANVISFSFNNNNEDGVDGDYFAGIDAAIPSTIEVYNTDTSGNAGDDVYVETVLGGGAPRGSVVNINTSNVLTFDQDNINFYQTFIANDATLKIDATSFHRLGQVTGTGTIQLVGSGNLPSGDYGTFFTCGGGKLVYEGRAGDNFEVLANLPIVQKVDVIGNATSAINISSTNITICDDFTIDGPQVFGANSNLLTVQGDFITDAGNFDAQQGDILVEGDFIMNNSSTFLAGNFGSLTVENDMLLGGSSFGLGTFQRKTKVKGDIIKTGGVLTQGTAGASLEMVGTAPQFIEGMFTGTSKVPSLTIANLAGVTLHNDLEVTDTLRLSLGNLNTGSDSLLRLANDGVDLVPLGGSKTSFVNGPMQWQLSSGIPARVFPTGKNERYRPLTLSSRSAARNWEVEYYDTLAIVQTPVITMDPFDPVLIKTVSIQEHWRVNSNTGGMTTARVGLSWGANSAVEPNPSDYTKLVVLEYNEGSNLWDSRSAEGSSFQYSAVQDQGSFLAAANSSFTERFFTLGSTDNINPLPVTWIYFTGETVDAVHRLSWATASEIDNESFELERSIDAKNWSVIGTIEGAGQSTSTNFYEYDDRNAPFGRVYYRVKQVDFDGKFEYANNVVTLSRTLADDGKKFDFILYPNPTINKRVRIRLNAAYSAAATITISDLSGKILNSEVLWVDGQGNSEEFNCDFVAGTYIVKVIVGNDVLAKPLVIAR